MKHLMSKEHYCYKIHTITMKSSAYLPLLHRQPPDLYKKILIPPFYDFSKITTLL